jgi:hypothetical protein
LLSHWLTTVRIVRFLTVCFLLVLTVILVRCDRSPEEAKIPLGNLESVAPGATITGTVSISGWAAADDGVKEVCLYVDRKLNSCTLDIHFSRPDVAQAWPSLPGASDSGWNIQLDTSTLPPGRHELVAQARSRSGGTRDLATVPVTISR